MPTADKPENQVIDLLPRGKRDPSRTASRISPNTNRSPSAVPARLTRSSGSPTISPRVKLLRGFERARLPFSTASFDPGDEIGRKRHIAVAREFDKAFRQFRIIRRERRLDFPGCCLGVEAARRVCGRPARPDRPAPKVASRTRLPAAAAPPPRSRTCRPRRSEPRHAHKCGAHRSAGGSGICIGRRSRAGSVGTDVAVFWRFSRTQRGRVWIRTPRGPAGCADPVPVVNASGIDFNRIAAMVPPRYTDVQSGQIRGSSQLMADQAVPHFQNEAGVPVIESRREGIHVHRRAAAVRPSAYFLRHGRRSMKSSANIARPYTATIRSSTFMNRARPIWPGPNPQAA